MTICWILIIYLFIHLFINISCFFIEQINKILSQILILKNIPRVIVENFSFLFSEKKPLRMYIWKCWVKKLILIYLYLCLFFIQLNYKFLNFEKVHVYIHVYMYTYMYTYIHIHVYVYMYMYMHTCNLYTHICVYMYFFKI